MEFDPVFGFNAAAIVVVLPIASGLCRSGVELACGGRSNRTRAILKFAILLALAIAAACLLHDIAPSLFAFLVSVSWILGFVCMSASASDALRQVGDLDPRRVWVSRNAPIRSGR